MAQAVRVQVPPRALPCQPVARSLGDRVQQDFQMVSSFAHALCVPLRILRADPYAAVRSLLENGAWVDGALQAPCSQLAEGQTFRVTLSRGLDHGARSAPSTGFSRVFQQPANLPWPSGPSTGARLNRRAHFQSHPEKRKESGHRKRRVGKRVSEKALTPFWRLPSLPALFDRDQKP